MEWFWTTSTSCIYLRTIYIYIYKLKYVFGDILTGYGLGCLPNRVALLGQSGSCIRIGSRWSFVGQTEFVENKVECNAEQKVRQCNAHDNRPSRNCQRTCFKMDDIYSVCVVNTFLMNPKGLFQLTIVMTSNGSASA